jgi:hypothetical protein
MGRSLSRPGAPVHERSILISAVIPARVLSSGMVGPRDQNMEARIPPRCVGKCNGFGRDSTRSRHGGHYDRPVRRGRRLLLLALAGLAAGACGRDTEKGLPSACPADSAQVLAALRQAPGAVRIDGVALSECLTKRSAPEQVQRIGATYVEAAAALSRRARRHPAGSAAVRLGYLVAAARRGASSTEGVHSELVRRLEQELRGVPSSAALRLGERTGRRSG